MTAFIREDDAAEDFVVYSDTEDGTPGDLSHTSASAVPAHHGGPDGDAALAARYGHTRRRRMRVRLLAWVTAAMFVVVFTVWVIWAGLGGSAQIQAQGTGHSFPSENVVSVSYEITMPPGTAATCAVQALNESFAIVGWKIVSIPASEKRTRAFTQLLHTSEPSTTGLIYRCWSA